MSVQIGAHQPLEREAARPVHLALGMPANDRMDWLVEKATELGAASIQPLISAHGVLRPSGERAEKKAAHWQAIAVAACEQCGRNRVPPIHPVLALADWLRQLPAPAADASTARLLLDVAPTAPELSALAHGLLARTTCWVLSGPEGGLNEDERSSAHAQGFVSAGLGPRVLRAETAPLAALMLLSPAAPQRAAG